MNKFEKKWANKKTRREEPKAIEGKDVPTLKKKGGKKACPGWRDHSRRPKADLVVPCQTCKRKFCSADCYDLHESICQAKFYESKTGDMAPLIDAAKAIYRKYIDKDGLVKKEHWTDEDKKDGRVSFMFRWNHGDLEEAMKILKKHEPEVLHQNHQKSYLWF